MFGYFFLLMYCNTTTEYKDWMEPPEEIIVIKPREQKSVTAGSSKNQVDEV